MTGKIWGCFFFFPFFSDEVYAVNSHYSRLVELNMYETVCLLTLNYPVIVFFLFTLITIVICIAVCC